MRVVLGLLAGLVASGALAQQPPRTTLEIPLSSHAATAAAQQAAKGRLVSCSMMATIHGQSEAVCEQAQLQFERDYVAAMRGDRVAQMAVANALAISPLRIVSRDYRHACAWWSVATSGSAPALTPVERREMLRACSAVHELDQPAVKERAVALIAQIRRAPTVALPAAVRKVEDAGPPRECLDVTATRLEDAGKPAPPHPRESAECRAALARQRPR